MNGELHATSIGITRTAAGGIAMAFAVVALAAVSPVRADLWPSHVNLRGYADLGVAITDDAVSWTDGGTGKSRYGAERGEDGGVRFVVPEASLIADAMWGASFALHVQAKYDDEQRHAVDIGDAYVVYRSPPRPGLRWRLRFGTFLPPMSLENHAIGWTSPYTLSSSALNTWLGEEIRINGPELRLLFRHRDTAYTIAAATFMGNDPAGSLIAYRGWAIHDRELGLFDDAPIPDFQFRIINPRGPFRQQADTFEPLHEIDGRPGFYGGIEANNERWGRAILYYYDNNADPEAINRTAGQYAWRTRFVTAGYRGDIAARTTLIVQALYGDTVMGGRVPPRNRHVSDTDYLSAYALLAKSVQRWQLAGRVEYFEVLDRDTMKFNYDNDETGWAGTGAVSFTPIERAKLTFELQYIDSKRRIRRYTGHPVRMDELNARLNLRWFF